MYFLRAARPILIDLAATLFFLVIYNLTHDIALAIVLGMALGGTQIGLELMRRKPVGPLQWTSLALVMTLGGASLVTRNPIFVMAKPSVVFAVVGVTMLHRDWLARYVPKIAYENLGENFIRRWGLVWAVLFGALAFANIAAALTLRLDDWLWYSNIAPWASIITLFLAQFVTFRTLIVRRMRAATRVAE